MVRGDQYLSIDTKIKFIETLVEKIQGWGVARLANDKLHYLVFLIKNCFQQCSEYDQNNIEMNITQYSIQVASMKSLQLEI